MISHHVSLERRRELVSLRSGITLEGLPASISGSSLPFAVVRNDRGQSAEWCWKTVDRIVSRDGAFRL